MSAGRSAGRTAAPRRPGAGPRPARGFTLVEVLVALVIMAVLATLAWQGVDGMVRTRDAAQARSERVLRLNTVLAQWEADLQHLHGASPVPAIAFDGAHMRLVRRAEGGVQLVAWSLREGELRRWSGPVVTRAGELQEQWMRSQQLQGHEPGHVRALSGVSEWHCHFWREGSLSNCQSSPGAATPSPPDAGGDQPRPPQMLPQGVRLIWRFAEGTLTRDFMLAPHAP